MTNEPEALDPAVRRAVAQAIVNRLEGRGFWDDGLPLKDDLIVDWIDQGATDFGPIADAAIRAYLASAPSVLAEALEVIGMKAIVSERKTAYVTKAASLSILEDGDYTRHEMFKHTAEALDILEWELFHDESIPRLEDLLDAARSPSAAPSGLSKEEIARLASEIQSRMHSDLNDSQDVHYALVQAVEAGFIAARTFLAKHGGKNDE